MAFKQWTISPETIFKAGPVIPVIVINNLDHAVPLAGALLDAGINVLEITLRTEVALEAIHQINQAFPHALVGAGTVKNASDLKQCRQAGAKFALSPGMTQPLLQAGKESTIPLIPGVASASELMEGLEEGYRYFKFFPAESLGGVGALKALSGPFPEAHFCPTGGIHQENAPAYLTLPNVLCVGGSWLLSDALIKQENWQALTEYCMNSMAGWLKP